MSTISAGTTATTTLVASGNTDGTLVFKTNDTGTGGTTALTLSATQAATFAGTLATSAKGITAGSLPAGSILQVLQTAKTDTFVSSATVTDTAITGLTVSITPTSSSNKILVICNLGIVSENAQGGAAKLTRTISASTTQISLADAAGSRSRGSFAGSAYRGSAAGYLLMMLHQGLTYLDSPATTSAITYGVQVSSITVGTYINRTGTDTDATDMYRGVSYITVMEIAA